MAKFYLSPKASALGLAFPGSFSLLLDAIAQHMGIGGSQKALTFGSNTPAVEDQDKPWLRTNLDGESVGWYIWTGAKWEPIEPIGKITDYNGEITEIPAGHRLCDGVGTFLDKNDVAQPIPDLRSKFTFGAGGSHIVGQEDGSLTQTLLVTHLPSAPIGFTTGSSGGHSHRQEVGGGTGNSITTRNGNQNNDTVIGESESTIDGVHNHSGSINLGDDTAFSILPPLVAFAKIIYTGL